MSEKCMHQKWVEIVCLVFGIISSIVNLLMLIASIVGIIMVTVVPRQVAPRYSSNGMYDSGYIYSGPPPSWVILGVAGFVIVGIASFIAFVFSVLLCNGICKKRAGQVQAYFIYGVTVTVLAVIAAVVLFIIRAPVELGIIILVACVLYSLFLSLVYHTYNKYSSGVVYRDHMRLVEG